MKEDNVVKSATMKNKTQKKLRMQLDDKWILLAHNVNSVHSWPAVARDNLTHISSVCFNFFKLSSDCKNDEFSTEKKENFRM